ncbi:MAG: hypothetical protein K2P17_05270 [Helicobacteraceae bacterium]|nr:hypothetical protein [Helicobacteraceae bacterium]
MNKPKEKQTIAQVIAREGIKTILFCIILILVFIFIHLEILALFVFIVLIFVVFIFRNTERIASYREKDSILAPCDGIIKDIIIKDNSTSIKIKINFFDNGIFRTPTYIDKIESKFRYGLFIKNNSSLKELLNTKHFIKGIMEDKTIYTITLMPEIWNKANIYEIDSAFAGDRLGFMKYGYFILTLYKPCKINVQIGDNLFAGETLIGKLL